MISCGRSLLITCEVDNSLQGNLSVIIVQDLLKSHYGGLQFSENCLHVTLKVERKECTERRPLAPDVKWQHFDQSESELCAIHAIDPWWLFTSSRAFWWTLWFRYVLWFILVAHRISWSDWSPLLTVCKNQRIGQHVEDLKPLQYATSAFQGGGNWYGYCTMYLCAGTLVPLHVDYPSECPALPYKLPRSCKCNQTHQALVNSLI